MAVPITWSLLLLTSSFSVPTSDYHSVLLLRNQPVHILHPSIAITTTPFFFATLTDMRLSTRCFFIAILLHCCYTPSVRGQTCGLSTPCLISVTGCNSTARYSARNCHSYDTLSVSGQNLYNSLSNITLFPAGQSTSLQYQCAPITIQNNYALTCQMPAINAADAGVSLYMRFYYAGVAQPVYATGTITSLGTLAIAAVSFEGAVAPGELVTLSTTALDPASPIRVTFASSSGTYAASGVTVEDTNTVTFTVPNTSCSALAGSGPVAYNLTLTQFSVSANTSSPVFIDASSTPCPSSGSSSTGGSASLPTGAAVTSSSSVAYIPLVPSAFSGCYYGVGAGNTRYCYQQDTVYFTASQLYGTFTATFFDSGSPTNPALFTCTPGSYLAKWFCIIPGGVPPVATVGVQLYSSTLSSWGPPTAGGFSILGNLSITGVAGSDCDISGSGSGLRVCSPGSGDRVLLTVDNLVQTAQTSLLSVTITPASGRVYLASYLSIQQWVGGFSIPIPQIVVEDLASPATVTLSLNAASSSYGGLVLGNATSANLSITSIQGCAPSGYSNTTYPLPIAYGCHVEDSVFITGPMWTPTLRFTFTALSTYAAPTGVMLTCIPSASLAPNVTVCIVTSTMSAAQLYAVNAYTTNGLLGLYYGDTSQAYTGTQFSRANWGITTLPTVSIAGIAQSRNLCSLVRAPYCTPGQTLTVSLSNVASTTPASAITVSCFTNRTSADVYTCGNVSVTLGSTGFSVTCIVPPIDPADAGQWLTWFAAVYSASSVAYQGTPSGGGPLSLAAGGGAVSLTLPLVTGVQGCTSVFTSRGWAATNCVTGSALSIMGAYFSPSTVSVLINNALSSGSGVTYACDLPSFQSTALITCSMPYIYSSDVGAYLRVAVTFNNRSLTSTVLWYPSSFGTALTSQGGSSAPPSTASSPTPSSASSPSPPSSSASSAAVVTSTTSPPSPSSRISSPAFTFSAPSRTSSPNQQPPTSPLISTTSSPPTSSPSQQPTTSPLISTAPSSPSSSLSSSSFLTLSVQASSSVPSSASVSSSSSQSNVGAIAGGVVGGVLGVTILVIALVCVYRSIDKRQNGGQLFSSSRSDTSENPPEQSNMKEIEDSEVEMH
jgi:hypothetical protein